MYSPKIVAIQGEQASFHALAAYKCLGKNIDLIGQESFADVFDSVENNKAELGVVAIENSMYGSINAVYDLLLKSNFYIVNEVYLRVVQNLLVFPGSNLQQIREVHSHPVALAQCQEYLTKHCPSIKRFEQSDTALSAKLVKQWADPTKAAIASAEAAKLYDLNILAKEIETNRQNYTRFIVISKSQGNIANANKTSLVLTTKTDTKPGALYKALGVFAERDINLTMIQSRPIIHKAWHYHFYLDIESPTSNTLFGSAQQDLEKLGFDLKVLGSYFSTGG